MKNYEDLTIQISVLKKSISLGKILQKEHPEIADIYGYYSQTDIPKMLDIQSEYGVGDNVAVNGVRYAIRGHEGSFGIEGYIGLISKEEIKKIEKERKEESQTKFSKMGRYW